MMSQCKILRSELKKSLELSAYGRNQVIYLAYFLEGNATTHKCKTCGKEIAEHDEGGGNASSLQPPAQAPPVLQQPPMYHQAPQRPQYVYAPPAETFPYGPASGYAAYGGGGGGYGQPTSFPSNALPSHNNSYGGSPGYLGVPQQQFYVPPPVAPVYNAPILGNPYEVMGVPLTMVRPVVPSIEMDAARRFHVGGLSSNALPMNLVLGSATDTAVEPYHRPDVWKAGVLFFTSVVYAVSFGLSVSIKGSGNYSGLFVGLFLVVCAVLIAWETTSFEVKMDKGTRTVHYAEWRLATFFTGPTRRTARFEDLVGDVAVCPDASSKQCWCGTPSRCILWLRLKTAGRPMAVQRVYNALAPHQATQWTQYISNMSQ